MDVNSSAIIYAFLVIPTLFALVVIGQGLGKLVREEQDGPVAVVVGVFLLVLIGSAYFLFIR